MIVLVIFLMLCHWAADFTQLSTPWMLAAKQRGTPLFPIFIHACVHGILMFVVMIFFTGIENALLLVAVQVCMHFIIDVWKGRMNGWFPSLENPANHYYWWLLGFDQFLHQVVIIMMALWIYK